MVKNFRLNHQKLQAAHRRGVRREPLRAAAVLAAAPPAALAVRALARPALEHLALALELGRVDVEVVQRAVAARRPCERGARPERRARLVVFKMDMSTLAKVGQRKNV